MVLIPEEDNSYVHEIYRLCCKQKGYWGDDYCVTVRDDKLFLTRPDDRDLKQIWYKDETVKNGFILVHKLTDKAVKYGYLEDQLKLVNKPINPSKSIIWLEDKDIKHGYTSIKTGQDPRMAMDALTGAIADGTKIGIYWNHYTDNQLWKLVRC